MGFVWKPFGCTVLKDEALLVLERVKHCSVHFIFPCAIFASRISEAAKDFDEPEAAMDRQEKPNQLTSMLSMSHHKLLPLPQKRQLPSICMSDLKITRPSEPYDLQPCQDMHNCSTHCCRINVAPEAPINQSQPRRMHRIFSRRSSCRQHFVSSDSAF